MDDAGSMPPPDINRGPEILAICGSLVGLALAVVLLRLWVRLRITRSTGWDDYCMIAAMTTVFVEMMIIIPQVHYGAGRHVQYIKPESNIAKGLHLNFATQPLCLIALCLAKVSVGLFLLRLSSSTRFPWLIRGVLVFTVLSATGNLLTVFFQCRPLAYTWDISVPGGKCIKPSHLKFAAFFNSGVSVLTDLLFALLPIPMLWKVRLNWKVKSAVAGILSLGIFATAAAIIKITYLGTYGKHGDFLFDSSDITIWTTVEICTAIVAACIPCLKPLFKAVLAGSSAGRYDYSKYPNKGYVRNNDTTTRSDRIRNAQDGQSNIEMYGSPVRKTNMQTTYRSKPDSEESIIPSQLLQFGGITKTTEVSISVDEYQSKSLV